MNKQREASGENNEFQEFSLELGKINEDIGIDNQIASILSGNEDIDGFCQLSEKEQKKLLFSSIEQCVPLDPYTQSVGLQSILQLVGNSGSETLINDTLKKIKESNLTNALLDSLNDIPGYTDIIKQIYDDQQFPNNMSSSDQLQYSRLQMSGTYGFIGPIIPWLIALLGGATLFSSCGYGSEDADDINDAEILDLFSDTTFDGDTFPFSSSHLLDGSSRKSGFDEAVYTKNMERYFGTEGNRQSSFDVKINAQYTIKNAGKVTVPLVNDWIRVDDISMHLQPDNIVVSTVDGDKSLQELLDLGIQLDGKEIMKTYMKSSGELQIKESINKKILNYLASKPWRGTLSVDQKIDRNIECTYNGPGGRGLFSFDRSSGIDLSGTGDAIMNSVQQGIDNLNKQRDVIAKDIMKGLDDLTKKEPIPDTMRPDSTQIPDFY